MPKPSEFTLSVIDEYHRRNPQEMPAEIDFQNGIDREYSAKRGYDDTIKSVCKEEGITKQAVIMCSKRAKNSMAIRLYITTEVKRLRNLYGPKITDGMIDNEVAESLSELIQADDVLIDNLRYSFI